MTLDKEDIYDIAKAVVKVIKDKGMMKNKSNNHASEKVQLQTLNAGDTFKVAGYEWIVLNQFKYAQTCFCIMKDFLGDTKPFDTYCNKWEPSRLRHDENAVKYDSITMEEVLDQKLGVIDLTATIMCLENKMPLAVFGLNEENSIENLMKGEFNGTYVTV